MIYLGIDSGLDGAIAAIYSSGDIKILLSPSQELSPGSTRRDYDLTGMWFKLNELIRGDPSPIRCIYELVHAMPDQSAQSGFLQGKGFGIWLGILVGRGDIAYQMVSPQRWKKKMLDGIPHGKQASVVRAQQLYPNVSLLRTSRSRVPDHNMADALMLAEYGRTCDW